MNAISQIKLGFSAYREAHRLIIQHKLYSYFFIPIAFNIAFLLLFSGLIWHWAHDWTQLIFDYFQLENSDWGIFDFLKAVVRFSIIGLMQLIGWIIYMLIYKNLILILLSPVLSMVAEQVNEIISGEKINFSTLQFFKNIVRGIVFSGRNFIKEVIYTALFLLATFIPLIGWISPVFIFAIQSYFYGSSIMDYVLEIKNQSVKQSTLWISDYKWLVLSIGILFNFLVLLSGVYAAFFSVWMAFFLKAIFVVPIFILSIFPIYSVVAATIAGLKIFKPANEPSV